MPAALAVILAGVAGACVGLWLAIKARARIDQARHARAQEIERIRAAADREGQTLRMQAEIAAREEALALRSEAETAFHARQVELAELEAALAGRSVLVSEEARALEEFRKELADREIPLGEMDRERQRLETEMASLRRQQRSELERVAKRLRTASRTGARGRRDRGGPRLRRRRACAMPARARPRRRWLAAAKRLMGISAGRMADHFYSERAQSIIRAAGEPGGPTCHHGG
jgi:hypothetical protein